MSVSSRTDDAPESPVPERRSSIGSILFAAGRGVRLEPLTDLLPKPALPMLDVPLGAFALKDLERHAPPVVVNGSHLVSELDAALSATGQAYELFVERPDPFGSAGTLRALAGRVQRRVVTRNADMLCDLDTGVLLAAHERNHAPATLAVQMVDSGADFLVEGGLLAGFVDRRETKDAAGARFIGAAVLEGRVLDLLPDRRPAGLGESLLVRLVTEGRAAMHVHEGYALDVGTPARYLVACEDLLAGKGPLPPLPFPGEFVLLPEGRAYVGPRADVAPGSLGPGSIVLAGARVPADARVEHAIVWPGEVVPEGAEVRRCIWAAGRAVPALGDPMDH